MDNALTLATYDQSLALIEARPLDRNPAAVYLAGLPVDTEAGGRSAARDG